MSVYTVKVVDFDDKVHVFKIFKEKENAKQEAKALKKIFHVNTKGDDGFFSVTVKKEHVIDG